MNSNYHTPVLVEAVTHHLHVNPDGIYIDGTLGGGGHAESILMNLSPLGQLIGFDVDTEAITYSKNRLRKFGNRIIYMQNNFSNIKNTLHVISINQVDGLLLDLGVSSSQFNTERGFSFMHDNKIDMRMNRNQLLDGWNVVNRYGEEKLADIFLKFGEDKNSRRIANRIIKKRSLKNINTTGELAAVVESAVGKRFLTKSLARTFQAIRIEVNNELENLKNALRESIDYIKTGGRIVVISYHSLEDRIVKEFFKKESSTKIYSHAKFLPDQKKVANLKIITKKPITPNEDEIQANPRARSAKLRAAERV